MPRGPRISYPNAVFHVINRFIDRHPFFQTDEDYIHFIDIYFEEADTFNIQTYAYALLPNHFHIVLETVTGEISRFLQRFLSRVAQSLNRKYERVGHLFQGRSKTLLIETDRYFETVMGYVLMNATRAGLTSDVFSYPWDSVSEMTTSGKSRLNREQLWRYLFKKEFDYDNIQEEIVLGRTWVKNINLKENEKTFKSAHRGSFLSTKTFREKILKQTERRKSTPVKGFRRKQDRQKKEWSWNEICHTARLAVDDKNWRGIWKNKDVATKHLRWYLAYAGGGWSLNRIREAEGEPGIFLSRFSMAIKKIRENERKTKIAETAVNLYLKVKK